MPRPTREQIDDDIVEAAAALFARHGFDQTSVQRIADAVGYSKTGLLHRFPTKESLQVAAVGRCVDLVAGIAADVAPLPPGPARDRAVVTAVADLALQRPGYVALMLGALGAEEGTPVSAGLQDIAEGLFRAFDAPSEGASERTLRVVGALGALAVSSLACHEAPAAEVRPVIIATAYAALGHERTT
ncbi:TetR family transcriptional regulator [Kineococcus sp. R8]|nr:TetR family transcriptional regulator [Kineococcus siccus]